MSKKMTHILFKSLPTDKVRALQNGGKDAHGHSPEKHISDGTGLPCRHCLAEVAEGDEYLILSYKPFGSDQAFAEQGPIFLHAENCNPYASEDVRPKMYEPDNQILLRGYSKDERIVYGTGQVIQNKEIKTVAASILATENVEYVHARSATNNCFQYRIERKS